MKFLITGANGQLGQAFQQLFRRRNIDYIATARQELDITELDQIRTFVNNKAIDIIINCAAYNAVDKAEEDWKNAYLTNGLGARNLVLAANEINAALVHYSTDYVFDGEKKKPYTIFDMPNPVSRYGESKLMGERFIQNLSIKYFLIRVSWVFGKGNDNFVTKVLNWSKNRNELKIVSDQVSSPTYTIDLATAIYNLIKTNAYGLYHITNLGFCSRYEWTKYILEKVGWEGRLVKAKSEEFNTPAKRPKFSVLDNFGLKETLKYNLPDWKNATDRFLEELGVI